MRETLLIVMLAVVSAACGDAGADLEVAAASTVPTQPPIVLSEPTPLLVISEVGGCFMLGPNCATTLVMSDGSFGVFRTDPANVSDAPLAFSDAEYAGFVDVSDLARSIAGTDFGELRRSLGPGACNGCVDGIDLVLRVFSTSGTEDLDSQQLAFETDVDLFRHLEQLQRDVADLGTLEPQPRGS
ncbi:MAG: hypothetical protein U9N84_05230 [Actinomycetota bacterium]|nr:hypothetical protein [Actinomycetota bacterium]